LDPLDERASAKSTGGYRARDGLGGALDKIGRLLAAGAISATGFRYVGAPARRA
jgi:hypothetical protein